MAANPWHPPGTNDPALRLAVCPVDGSKYEVPASDPSFTCPVCGHTVQVPVNAPEPGGSGITRTIRTVTANTTLTASDDGLHIDATAILAGNTLTVTLPLAASVIGKQFTFYRTDINDPATVTLACSGADTIAGSLSQPLGVQQTQTLTAVAAGVWQ